MGVYDRKGSLQKDKDADILIMDKELNIRAVWQDVYKRQGLENFMGMMIGNLLHRRGHKESLRSFSDNGIFRT